LTTNIFNKTTVSYEESLYPGPEARAGLHQGVPGKEPHHLLHLLDQITGFVARLCIDPLFRDATYKTVKRVLSGKLGSQTSSTHTSVRFSLSQSCILLLSWAGLLSCLGISSYLSTILRQNLIIFALFILINFSNFFSAS
jgi:hypothetical protein